MLVSYLRRCVVESCRTIFVRDSWVMCCAKVLLPSLGDACRCRKQRDVSLLWVLLDLIGMSWLCVFISFKVTMYGVRCPPKAAGHKDDTVHHRVAISLYFDHYYHALHVCGVASQCQHWSTLVHKSRLYVRCRLVFRKRSCIENRPEEGWAEKLGCRTRWQMRKSPASWAAHFGVNGPDGLVLAELWSEATCRSSWKCELMHASWRSMGNTWKHGEIARRPPSPHTTYTTYSRSNEASP